MFEYISTWDILPGVDEQAYAAYAKKVIGAALRQPGFVEFRANRSLMGSPQSRATFVWQALADWAAFAATAEYQALETEGRQFMTNTHVELWGPSPIVPEPIRPGT
jgi:heme-degrading monooxygenase HmoA